MDTIALADRYGRIATDLRVSLTDRCNLRCSYCMPAEGLDWLPGDEVLTDDEVVRLIDIGVRRLGVREVRFTGGEPLVRRGLIDIVRRTKAIDPTVEVSLTTNALGLERTAVALADAGLDRVNVSLDTVRGETFHTITRRDRFDDVIAGLAAARAAGLTPVKINAVLLRGTNDDQAPELLRWAVGRGLRAAVHRADAARRPARLEPDRDGHGRGDPGQPRAGVHADPGRPSRGGAPRPSGSPSTAARPRSA